MAARFSRVGARLSRVPDVAGCIVVPWCSPADSRLGRIFIHRCQRRELTLLPRIGTSGSSRVRQAGPATRTRTQPPGREAGRRGRSRCLGIRPDADHGAWSGDRGNPHAYPPYLAQVVAAGMWTNCCQLRRQIWCSGALATTAPGSDRIATVGRLRTCPTADRRPDLRELRALPVGAFMHSRA